MMQRTWFEPIAVIDEFSSKNDTAIRRQKNIVQCQQMNHFRIRDKLYSLPDSELYF